MSRDPSAARMQGLDRRSVRTLLINKHLSLCGTYQAFLGAAAGTLRVARQLVRKGGLEPGMAEVFTMQILIYQAQVAL